MKISSIQIRTRAAVYAEVLLEAAKASDRILAIAEEFDELVKAVRGSIELRNTLVDNSLSLEVKQSLVDEIFSESAPELLTVFMVMIEREDLPVLARAYEAYTALAEEALGAVMIDVTTVVPLDDNLRNQIINKYSSQLGTGVLLREHIDPNLIGGIVLSTHGKRIDASVLSQLENARHVLSKV